MGRTWYVNSELNGNGISPESAAASYRQLDIQPGDTVLFARDSVYRDALISVDGTKDAPIFYGAYGTGERPLFLGSTDVSAPEDWEEIQPNIWKCRKFIPKEVGNIIFRDKTCGILAWEMGDMRAQGQWHDTLTGAKEENKHDRDGDYALHLYSVGNPAEVYGHIECAHYGERKMVCARKHVRFEGLAFHNSGVHGFASSDVDDVIMRDCEFAFIGGMVWSLPLRIRFGNAFELWQSASNVTMENCSCYEIYDSCFTHQGNGEACPPAKNIRCVGNRFEKYGMAAYEARDKVSLGAVFNGNTCLDAGLGFAMQDETPPRKSEIWPQPMGHHLFIWRMPRATEGGRIEVRGNTFGAAPYGAAVYSIVSPEAEAQFDMDENIYDTKNVLLSVRWNGTDYSGSEFEKYKSECHQDANSREA